MMRALLLLLFLFPATAQANAVVADLSNYRIEMDASFNGTRMFLFGTRNEGGDVVVVIRGPEKDFTVRKKQRILGVWVNGRHMEFDNVPQFYAVVDRNAEPHTADTRALYAALGIGMDNFLVPNKIKPDTPDFAKALVDYQSKKRLLQTSTDLQFMGETLFKTAIDFPDTIPKGDYTAEIYLLRDGKPIGMQALPITVRKSGLDAFISDLAHEQPFLYGLFAIGLALGAGYIASRVFVKIG